MGCSLRNIGIGNLAKDACSTKLSHIFNIFPVIPPTGRARVPNGAQMGFAGRRSEPSEAVVHLAPVPPRMIAGRAAGCFNCDFLEVVAKSLLLYSDFFELLRLKFRSGVMSAMRSNSFCF